MAETHLNPEPGAPEGRAAGNVIPFRRRERLPEPPDISICEIPLFCCSRCESREFHEWARVGRPSTAVRSPERSIRD